MAIRSSIQTSRWPGPFQLAEPVPSASSPLSARLTRLPDDTSEHGAVMEPDSGVGDDHPMRQVTRQVAFEGGWSASRARKVADLFDGMASEWDAPRSGLVRTAPIRDALARGGLLGRGRWLELGAGTGVGTRILGPAMTRSGGSVIALDLALEMLLRSPSRAAPLVQGDASGLPFPDGVFDGAAMVNMLLFPAEIDRVVTANGGQLVWINTSGDRTPIHLSPEDFLAALPGGRGHSSAGWSAVWARSGTGFWVVATRASVVE